MVHVIGLAVVLLIIGIPVAVLTIGRAMASNTPRLTRSDWAALAFGLVVFLALGWVWIDQYGRSY